MRLIIVTLAVISGGCSFLEQRAAPESYPIPPQHSAVDQPPVLGYGVYVKANDPDAEAYFVKDLKQLEVGKWRWTNAEPEFRFSLKGTDRLKFRLEFGAHPVLMKDVGPLRFTIFINDHRLSTETFTTPGDRTYEKPVPSGWLVKGLNIVRIKVENPWPAKDPGVYLGFIFHGAGFVH